MGGGKGESSEGDSSEGKSSEGKSSEGRSSEEESFEGKSSEGRSSEGVLKGSLLLEVIKSLLRIFPHLMCFMSYLSEDFTVGCWNSGDVCVFV